MANMIKDLLAPSQAKLLDDQLRRQQLQEGVTNYGSDPLGKFLTAASGAQRASAGVGMAAERALGGRQMGVNEAAAVERQEGIDAINSAMSDSTGATPVAKLKSAIENLGKSKNRFALQKKAQLEAMLPQVEQQQDKIDLEARKVKVAEDREKRLSTLDENAQNKSVVSTETVFDDVGNMYQKIVYKNGNVVTKPVTEGAPETIQGRIITKQERQGDATLNRQIDVQNNRAYLDLKDAAREDFKSARSGFSSAKKVFELVEKSKDNVGGFINVGLTEVKKYLGYASDAQVDVQTLDKALKEDALKQLKPIFGGNQITEGERNFLLMTLPSIMDGPEVIKRKAEANLKMQKRIMDRSLALSKTKGYTEYVDTENSFFGEDYEKMLEEYDDLIRTPEQPAQPASSTNTVNFTPEQAAMEIKRREAERQKNLVSTTNIGDYM